MVTSGITPSSRRAGCQLPSNERSGFMKSFHDDLTNYVLVSDLLFWVRLLGKLSKVTSLRINLSSSIVTCFQNWMQHRDFIAPCGEELNIMTHKRQGKHRCLSTGK